MHVTVRCVNAHCDAFALDFPRDQQQIQVVQIKRMILYKLSVLSSNSSAKQDEEEAIATSFVFFHGRILADVDYFDLNCLHASDFFVFAWDDTHEPPPVLNTTDQRSSRKRKRSVDHADMAILNQLVAMGFDQEAAKRAVCQTANNMELALGILTGDVNPTVVSMKKQQDSHVDQWLTQYPVLKPIEALLRFDPVHELRSIAAIDPFQALSMLRDVIPRHLLTLMNENPAAVLTFLTLPANEEAQEDEEGEEVVQHDTSIQETADTTGQTIVLSDDDEQATQDLAIERLCAMGFDRTLVVAAYESCGRNEHFTANALIQMLE